MKILLICNSILPEIINKHDSVKGKPESWISGHVAMISKWDNIEIIYTFPLNHKDKPIAGTIGKIRYYSYHEGSAFKYHDSTEKQFVKIFRKEKPDVIHVFGIEYPHSLAAVNAAEICGLTDYLVISLQGLTSIIGKYHYYANLPQKTIHQVTFRDFLKRDSIIKQRNGFIMRGKFETQAIEKAKHVIGRTEWDKACTRQINTDINYHFCNENLREIFYNNKWALDQCERHSIFVSQSGYPVKGFHLILEAMVIVLKRYPDAKLYTTGNSPVVQNSIYKKLRQSSYVKYLRDFIEQQDLTDCIHFCGFLDEKKMCDRYLNSHVFVSCSSIENSSNSVGEAMSLGMPVISSLVGGLIDRILHGVEGYTYQYDAPYMLAHYIMKVFEDDDKAVQLGLKAQEKSKQIDNVKENERTVKQIYSIIISQNIL